MADFELFTSKDLETLGKSAKKMIENRIQKGISLDGTQFKPKEDGSASTLIDTGRLLGSFRVIVDNNTVSVVTDVPYAKYVGEDRPFMGLTTEEEDILRKEFESIVQRNFDNYINSLFSGNSGGI